MATSGGPNIVTDGLVLHLDAGSTKSYPGSGTTWYDLSGNGNNGTLTNGPTFFDNSLVFDGVNDSHAVNLSTLPNFSQITFNCWYNSNVDASTCLLTSGPIIFHFRGAGFYLRDNSGGNSGYLAFNPTPSAFRWNMFSGTWDGTVMKIYINGIKQATERGYTGGANGLLSNNGSFTIGGYFNVGQPWTNGSLSHSQIYNKALTPEEVLQNYNATKSRFNL